MKSKGISGGLVLILIGVFWLLTNFGVISWSLFDVMFRLWPLILIVIGINTIFRTRNSVKYITWGIFFIIIILYGFYGQYGQGNNAFVDAQPNLVLEKSPETTSGKLKLQLGGGNITLNSTDEKLINARIPNSTIKKDVRFSNGNSKVNIELQQRSQIINFGTNQSYTYNFDLSENLLWDIDLDMGAINGTMDFSNLRVSKLDMDIGASNLDLIFGDREEHTRVDIDGGVTNLEITVPENLGVRVDIDGGIKNTNIRGLAWKKIGDCYESPNYDEAAKKLEIDINTGIGKFDVRVK